DASRRAERLDELRPQVDELANYFEIAFNEGTDGVWKSFKRQGLSVIAELLAKMILNPSSLGSGAGLFSSLSGGGGLFGTVFGGLFKGV
uniref:hypothetical protein n=1 Tax=Salmonella enterica TaxID=28901 RepID=UPI003296CD46